MIIFHAIYFAYFLLHGCESKDEVTCPCGETKSNFTIVREGNSDPCSLFQFCGTCSDYTNRCTLCPKGRYGKYCTELLSKGYPGLPILHNVIKSRHKRSHCVDLQAPKFGSMSCLTRTHEKICTGKCAPGYFFEGPNREEVILTCRNERWMPSSKYPNCVSAGLCDLELVGAGGHNCTAGTSGTYCTITCYGDHSVVNPYHCYPGQGWQPPLPSCVAPAGSSGAAGAEQPASPEDSQVMCPSPKNIANGRVQIQEGSPGNQGLSALYSCDDGFTLHGQSRIECFPDGVWSNDEPVCVGDPVPAVCDDPGKVRNADREVENMDFEVGSRVSYICQDDFQIQGESDLICLESGEWNARRPICIKKRQSSASSALSYCQYPGAPLNSEVKLIARSTTESGWTNSIAEAIQMLGKTPSNSHFQQIEVGSKIRYRCRSSYYSLEGSFYQTCQENGKWSGRQPVCKPKCGHSEAPRTPYIHRGNATVVGQWPWQIAIVLQETRHKEGKLVCGGSLLEDRWVVTAAHCVTQHASVKLMEVRKVFVYAGKYYRSFSRDDDQVQRKAIRQILIHRDYNYVNLDSDIALLQMDSPVELNGRVQPVCLPDERTSRLNIKDNNKAIVTGWGMTEKEKESEVLLQAELPVWTQTRCQEKHLHYRRNIRITENMFCAGYDEGRIDSCRGDSGGPLVFRDPRNDQFTLEGIVSWGNKDGCGLANSYSGFTKVINFVEWIREYI